MLDITGKLQGNATPPKNQKYMDYDSRLQSVMDRFSELPPLDYLSELAKCTPDPTAM